MSRQVRYQPADQLQSPQDGEAITPPNVSVSRVDNSGGYGCSPPTQPPKTMIRFDATAYRLWIARYRIHHGFTGAVLALTGLAAMYHDRKDWRRWFLFR